MRAVIPLRYSIIVATGGSGSVSQDSARELLFARTALPFRIAYVAAAVGCRHVGVTCFPALKNLSLFCAPTYSTDAIVDGRYKAREILGEVCNSFRISEFSASERADSVLIASSLPIGCRGLRRILRLIIIVATQIKSASESRFSQISRVTTRYISTQLTQPRSQEGTLN